MYNGFFGFRERPFKLVPNPDFLFLGKSHEEALAHLAYATSQGDGFVEITGEVGTGKTTLCRVFLEDLDENIEAAFIFNSKLDAAQLIRTIHTELGIDLEDQTDPTRTLNNFLLEKKAMGKSVILLIDEAQNLAPETLEQLRLLSNLETTKSKLLQIILVGQPELGDILDSHEMRQLRQRINLSCHILPLTPEETGNYIDHRVSVASHKPQRIFTRKAKDLIYAYSRGIPRLINIVCDRSLLTAYSLNKKEINSSIVKTASRELSKRDTVQMQPLSFFWKLALLFFTLVFAGFILLMFVRHIPSTWMPAQNNSRVHRGTGDQTLDLSSTPGAPVGPGPLTVAPEAPSDTPRKAFTTPLGKISEAPPEPEPVSDPVIKKTQVIKLLTAINSRGTRETVLTRVLSLWNGQASFYPFSSTQEIDSDSDFFGIAARQNNLEILRVKADLSLVETFNLPAVVTIALPDHQEKIYLGIVGITRDHEYIIFPGNDDETCRVDPDDLGAFLTGDVYIAWRNIFGSAKTISKNSSSASVLSVKLFLRQIGFSSIDLTADYDDTVTAAVKQVQAKYGLVPDGIVGPFTKIVLFNEENPPASPLLSRPDPQNKIKVN